MIDFTDRRNTMIMKKREQLKSDVLNLLNLKDSKPLKVGELLTELKKGFAKTVDFVGWCKDELDLGKSSVFRYLKVYDTFGSSVIHKDTPLRILSRMVYFKDYKLIEKTCDELAISGKLTLKSLNEVIELIS